VAELEELPQLQEHLLVMAEAEQVDKMVMVTLPTAVADKLTDGLVKMDLVAVQLEQVQVLPLEADLA
jgi:hypothetical protein